ncbi:MAG: TRAP transporter small permease subunit [Burkholderiaceae bacterium]|nr:TRAP transporter small permease subunit [Burkholderiaceae bacterium]
MKEAIARLERAVELMGVASAMLLVPLVLATTWEVVARYVFGAPTIWAYEVGYFLTGSHFLLGLSYTLKHGEHIRIDIFSTKMSPALRRQIDLVMYALVTIVMAWLTYALLNYLLNGLAAGERTGQSALNLPVWPFRLVFVIAFFTFTVQLILEFLKTLVMRHRQGT